MTRKEMPMNRERFSHLLEAYGGDFRRWPAQDRASAAAFAAQHPDVASAIEAARALDAALDAGREELRYPANLAASVLARAPRPQNWGLDRRAMIALAACAVFGVVAGYGGGLLAPEPAQDESYFTMAFEAPLGFEDEG